MLATFGKVGGGCHHSCLAGATKAVCRPTFRPRGTTRTFASSVTGPVYTNDDPNAPVLTLYTKAGCTLCDKVKDVLMGLPREQYPHSLRQIDITDSGNEEWYDKYKYDIPVVRIGSEYWIKHRLDEEEARKGLQEAIDGIFQPRKGEPNAAAMERKQLN
jgi:hypothetical protein